VVLSQRRGSRVPRRREDERMLLIIFSSLYRLDVGMDEFRSRNGTGTHTDGVGARVGDGWVVIWFRSGNIQVMNIGLFS